MPLSRLTRRFETRRIAAFAMAILALSLLTTAVTEARQGSQTSRDNNRLLQQQERTLTLLEEDNRRLGVLLDVEIKRREDVQFERDLLFAAATEQARRLRELGGDPVDIFNPDGSVDTSASPPQVPGVPSTRRSPRGSSPDQGGDAEPSPRPSPAPSPRPTSPPPVVPIPAPTPVPCVMVPILNRCLIQ